MGSSRDRVIAIAAETTGISVCRLSGSSALDQDLDIAGDDIQTFAGALEREFEINVWSWPWQRFVVLDEGLSLLFPFMVIWQFVSWPFRGRFSYPNGLERLELGHIAAVIDTGEWFEP